MCTTKISPTQQTVILLALAASSLITVRDNELIPELEPVTFEGSVRMLEIIRDYPVDRKETFENTNALMSRVSTLINRSQEWFSVEAVVCLGTKICTDLLGEVCNQEKRNFILEAMEIFKTLDDFLDPDGDNTDTLIEVEEILEKVYKEIGFGKELRYIKHWRKLQRRLRINGRAACR